MASPKKHLGQHWLRDKSALSHIVDIADVEADDAVLEIGPGLGTLTSVLLQRAASVTAVEYDQDLAAKLPAQFPGKRLNVIHHDILTFDLGTLGKDYKVVANVPYYITSKIIKLLLESANQPKSMTLLVQKEVAERIAAEPGAMSILAISAQAFGRVSLGEVVKASLFTPAPEVDSQVIKIEVDGFHYDDIGQKSYFKVVKAGFSERRKKLRSSLSGALRLEKVDIDTALSSVGIATEARAQELSLDDWAKLTMYFKEKGYIS